MWKSSVKLDAELPNSKVAIMTLCRRVGYYDFYQYMTYRAKTANLEPPLPLQLMVHLSCAVLLLLESFTIYIKY